MLTKGRGNFKYVLIKTSFFCRKAVRSMWNPKSDPLYLDHEFFADGLCADVS